MKFLVDTYSKESMHEVSRELKGEIVNENETIVIVDYRDMYSLNQRLNSILVEEFNIERYKY